MQRALPMALSSALRHVQAAVWRRPGSAWQSWRAVAQFTALEDELYRHGPSDMSAWLGPLQVALLAGRGRGVTATHDVRSGELLLCCHPAAILHGQPEEQPEATLLIKELLRTTRAAAWPAVQQLYNGTDLSAQLQPDLQRLVMGTPSSSSSSNSNSNSSTTTSTSTSNGQGSTVSSSGGDADANTLADIIKLNAFGDDYEDLAAAAVRRCEPTSHVGLWPGFSFFNHSCLPNTVHYVVGDAMVVRATNDISKGEEVTVSYLGREEFAPAAARQQVLHERYGFLCSCERCQAEGRVDEKLQQLLAHAHDKLLKELQPAFEAAVGASDQTGVAMVAAQLQQLADQLDGALSEASLPAPLPQYLQASVYSLLELQHFCSTLTGSHDEGAQGAAKKPSHNVATLSALSRCLSIVDLVSRGAELHVFLASALLRHAADAHGADSAAAQAAAALVEHAHVARYGASLSDKTMLALMEANRTLSEEFIP